MTSKLSRAQFLGLMTVLMAMACPGCGSSSSPEATKTEDRAREQKVQELVKKGYDFREISAIMKGQEPEPRPKTKGRSKR